MQRFIGSMLIGFILFLLLDFLIFIGIKINYIDLYRLKIYFNSLFVDNQNYLLMVSLSLIFGYCFVNKKSAKIFSYTYLVLIFLSLSTFYRPIGENFAKILFKKDNVSIKFGKIKFKGDLLYMGRKNFYIYRKDIKKVVKLPISKTILFSNKSIDQDSV